MVAFNADPETLDPHITTALLAVRAMAPFYDTLILQDYDGSFKPALATSWSISKDGLTYTFTLRKGVTFHSGKAFSSADVVSTYNRWRSPAIKSPTAYQIAPLDTVIAPDPQTVVFKLKQPYNIFLDQVASGYAVILNKGSVDKAGKNYGVTVVDGTGPFRFASWSRGQKLVGTRFDSYTWGSPIFTNHGPAHVSGLEIRIVPDDNTRMAQFKSGDLNIVNDVPPSQVASLDKESSLQVIRFQQLNTSYMGFNIQNSPVSDINVRKAINMAINKDEIVKGAYFGLGKPAHGILTPQTPGYGKGVASIAYPYDPSGAQKLLDSAGWKMGSNKVRAKGGKQLIVPLWIINDSTDVLQAQIVEQQLGDIGIKIATKQYEQTAWFAAARTGKQVAFFIGVFFGNADVLYFYFFSKQRPAPNRFGYSDPTTDKLLLDSRSNLDRAKVLQDYQQLEDAVVKEALFVPIIHQLGTVGATRKTTGVKPQFNRWLYQFLDINITA